MSDYYYGPALNAELDYRRDVLRRSASDHRLVRLARKAARAERRSSH